MSGQLTITVKPRTRPRKWPWFILGSLVLAVALVWAAPHIVALTPLRDVVVARLFPHIDGDISSGSASLDWFAPVEFNDVTVADRNGNTVLRVGKIQSQKTLFSLLLKPDEAGSFQIEQADLQLQVHGNEFNLEKILAGYFNKKHSSPGKSSSRSGALSIAMEFLNSRISQHDADTDRQVKIEKLHGKVNLAANSAEPLTVELHGTLVEGDGKSNAPGGNIDAVFHWLADDAGEFKIQSDGMTLAAVNPLLRRAGIDAELSGSVHGHCVYRWGKKSGQESCAIEADIASDEVFLGGPWLGSDRIRLQRVTLPCRAALVGSRVQVDKANLTADLGQASLSGTWDLEEEIAEWFDEPGCTFFADVDLAALVNQLPETLHLQSGTNLTRGRVQVHCISQKTSSGTSWDGNLSTTALHGTRHGKAISWPETVALDFRARKSSDGLPIIDQLRADSRFLKMDASGSSDNFKVRLDVDLEKLAEPLSQFVDLSAWHLRGQGWATLAVRADQDNAFQVETAGNFKNLKVVTIEDPALEWQARGRWSPSGRSHISDGLLRTSNFALQTTGLDMTPLASGKRVLSGKAALQGDIARLRHWLADPQHPITTPVTGQLVATIDLQSSEPLQGVLDVQLANVVVGQPKSPTWREPSIRIWTQIRRGANDDVLIDRFYLETQALVCDARGHVLDPATRKSLDLQGVLKYDLAKLEPALRTYLGSDAKLVGKEKHPFQMNGRLVDQLSTFSGQAEFGWQALRAYGGDVGPADLKLSLRDGWLRAESLHTTFNGGKLHLQPSVRLEPDPAELLLGSGVVVEKARITAAMSSGVLGYAVPVLAGVTTIDGQVSLSIDGVRMPLAAPPLAEMTGKLHVHNARFGATKLVQELGAVFKTAPPSVQINDCVVPVKMTGGKVYHEGLEFVAADVSVRTSGWVASDGQMNLLAEMRIPERWLSKISPTLAKQTIKLPIRGTLGAPQVDEASLQSALDRLTRDAAGKLLKRELEDRLKKLFPR